MLVSMILLLASSYLTSKSRVSKPLYSIISSFKLLMMIFISLGVIRLLWRRHFLKSDTEMRPVLFSSILMNFFYRMPLVLSISFL